MYGQGLVVEEVGRPEYEFEPVDEVVAGLLRLEVYGDDIKMFINIFPTVSSSVRLYILFISSA